MVNFLTLLFMSSTVLAKTQSMSTRYEKGFFSVGLLSGYSQSRTLNADTTFSKFTGMSYGLQFEVALSQSDSGSIRFVGNWSQDVMKEKESVYRQESDSLGGGLKFYANSFLYMQASYGEIRQKYDSASFDYTVKNKYVGLAMGADFSITESLMLGAGVQYTANPIKKTSSISSNSFSESGQFYLSLSWSPPITIINTIVTSSGR